MNSEQLDALFDKLVSAHHHATDRRLVKANAEIDAIQREDVAYYDGAYDAITKVKALLKSEVKESDG